MTNQELAAYIDHTILKPETTAAQVSTVCDEAKKYGFKTVCVNPGRVPQAKKELAGSAVGITTVVGFPLGATTPATKAFEADEAIKNGATEVDMVINIGALKDGDKDTVRDDIAAVKKACGSTPLKVILETCLLSDEEIETACRLSVEAKADFVKTSTGFSTAGSNPHVVALMRKTVGPDTGVKASGGVRSREDAMKIIEAGASRIGTSSGVKILEGEEVSGGY